MRTIETRGIVTDDGELIVKVTPDIPAGEHNVVVVIEERLMERLRRPPLDLPVHDFGPWPENLSLRREDMYDDWGR